MDKIKCKDCIYNSGVKCHGHGEFWAECEFLVKNANLFKKIFNLDILQDVVPKGGDCWSFVINDDSDCKIFEIKDYRK